MTRLSKYEMTVEHKELHKSRTFREVDYSEAKRKANEQKARWDEEWNKKSIKLEKQQTKEAGFSAAEEMTQKALRDIQEISNILQHTLSIDDTIKWESLLRKDGFLTKKPSQPPEIALPTEPQNHWPIYQPKFSFWDNIFQSRKIAKESEAKERFMRDHALWQEMTREAERGNKERDEAYNKALEKWEDERTKFEKSKQEKNDAVLTQKKRYFEGDADAITDYCEMVLFNSKYPEYFPSSFEAVYNTENRMVVLSYQLPAPNEMPTVKEVKYVATKGDFKESYISDADRKRMYDSAIYQICLRTIHELFEADVVSALDAIAFNGMVDSIDSATGQDTHSCIMSIVVTKQDFMKINLSNVEPKDCFKKLKGVASSALHSLTPIAPVIQFDKNDKRFIVAREIMGNVTEVTNLASMDWQDFEHLVREIFEKEFSVNGGEVKVTQSSRDAGVDAIAFDPDPIRGGKIVIQAKRYTNTVNVSAVRDLYGTVVNEGATKGILITTSDFGPDSYEFAQGKPLSLLNGNNLLHLLQKHGTNAVIDIIEAKKLLQNQ